MHRKMMLAILVGIGIMGMAIGASQYLASEGLFEHDHLNVASSTRGSYTAVATVWLENYAQVIGLDEEGNITLKET